VESANSFCILGLEVYANVLERQKNSSGNAGKFSVQKMWSHGGKEKEAL